jgi:hypothetical protein
MSALPVVALCSRRAFSGRVSLRVVDSADTSVFRPFNRITREQINENPFLAEIASLDATQYLLDYCGIPGLVKGVKSYGSGMLVFSENLKYYTRLCDSRVSGNKIKFNHGTEEIKERREDCWEFCVKRERLDIICPQHRQDAQVFDLVLKRDEDTCPICFDKLTGRVVCCASNHQVCLTCFNLLPLFGGVKKCVLCNCPNYTLDELDKVERMNGKIVKGHRFFYSAMSSGCNSFKDFTYKEALFLGTLRIACYNGDYNLFQRMLMSALFNYYTTHQEAFSDYNFNLLNQVDYNNRTYNPFSDDLPPVIKSFLENIHTPQVFNDVAHTLHYSSGYDDIDFYSQLEDIEGNIQRLKDYPNGTKDILKREIFFRYKIKHTTPLELEGWMKTIFKMMLNSASKYSGVYNLVVREIE